MDMQCYKLVNYTRDKLIAYAKGLTAVVFGVGMTLPLLMMSPNGPFVKDAWPLWLMDCLIILVVGPMILIDALTIRICITDKGISRESTVSRRSESNPWIDWEHLVSVKVRSNPRRASGIEKIIVNGRHEIHGLGGAYWQPRRVVIPGHLPDIQRILASLQEHAHDKFDM